MIVAGRKVGQDLSWQPGRESGPVPAYKRSSYHCPSMAKTALSSVLDEENQQTEPSRNTNQLTFYDTL
jgi:hypothetical protein